MNDQDKSPMKKILDEISSPWDWAAAAIGGAAGAMVAFFVQDTDIGTSISAGAIIGIAARKAVYVSLHSRRLGKRFTGLKEELQEHLHNTENHDVMLLMQQLDLEHRLWKRKAIPDEEFSKQVDVIINDYRKTAATPSQLLKDVDVGLEAIQAGRKLRLPKKEDE